MAIPIRARAPLCIVAATLVAACATVAYQMDRTRVVALAILAALPALIEIGTAGLGAHLVYTGWPRRAGRGLHCRRCGYHQESEGRITPTCPECGAPWRWIGYSSIGRPIRRWWVLWAGIGLVLFAGSAAIVREMAPWVALRLLPNQTLLRAVALLPDDAVINDWDELMRRQLPIATMDALAEPLLKKKQRYGYLSPVAETTLFDAVTRPGAPQGLIEAYFAPFLTAHIDLPERIIQGQTLTVRTAAAFHGAPVIKSPAPRIVVLSMLQISGNPNPPAHWEWEVNVSEPGQGRQFVHDVGGLPPGKAAVRQVFWLLVNPGPIAWSGPQPMLPLGSPVFAQYEVERAVEVTPPDPPVPGTARGSAR